MQMFLLYFAIASIVLLIPSIIMLIFGFKNSMKKSSVKMFVFCSKMISTSSMYKTYFFLIFYYSSNLKIWTVDIWFPNFLSKISLQIIFCTSLTVFTMFALNLITFSMTFYFSMFVKIWFTLRDFPAPGDPVTISILYLFLFFLLRQSSINERICFT